MSDKFHVLKRRYERSRRMRRFMMLRAEAALERQMWMRHEKMRSKLSDQERSFIEREHKAKKEEFFRLMTEG